MVNKFVVTDDELEELIFRYCRDYTTLARKGRFDRISGRDREIKEVMLILLQKGRKNAVLLAPAGVGKTALVVGLAQEVIRGNIPEYLDNARVIEIDLASMAAGTNSAAEFQSRFIPLCRGFAERYHVKEYPKFVIFIDEVHMIMPTCKGSGYAGLSEVMKPYMTMGDLHIIGATTLDEYRIYVKEDAALDRRFQQVPLTVPTPEETYNILKMLKDGYENHHGIEVTDECVKFIIKLTEEHMPRRFQPDKSIIVMDGACAWQVLDHGRGGELSLDSIRKMVSIECKLSPGALN